MYKFTKDKEMKELKELFEKGMINKFKSSENIWHNIELFDTKQIFVDDTRKIVDVVNVVISGFWCFNSKAINWEETAKLVKSDVDKEEKMEKILVRSWEDLKNVKGKMEVEQKGDFMNVCYYLFSLKTFKSKNGLEKMIKALNALGGNFEYQEVEVIDTYEKWEEFQKDINKEGLIYSRESKVFVKVKILSMGYITSSKHQTIEEIEKQFNVDLQILRGE